MTEEHLFLAALDQPGASARNAYLDEACGDDAQLRGKVEALLAAHFQSGEFLDVPAPDQIRVESGFTNAVTIESQAMSASRDPDSESESLDFLSPTTRPDSLGRIGHYEVLQVLGRGGFGIVLRAFDDVLQRVVAVKVMAPLLAATSPARKRFLREARTSAQVRHDNVVQVYEVGEQPLPYLVMEFIPGETLQQRLDRMGPLDIPETLRIGHQIAEGLAAAHAVDLIHRDIKPGNVLLEGGQHKVKITDFGLARAADDASMTQSGTIAGTPMYMAPEQALGETLDQRADLFSLGSVLYQMVAGRPPFRANTAVAVLKRVVEDTPRNIREVIPETPQWLCDIIAKLHAKKPDDRYQSAREVADVLADCEDQLKQNSRLRDFSRIPHTRAASTGRWKWVAAGVLTALLVLVGSYLLFQNFASGWTASPHGREIAGWGIAVDPKRDCQITLEDDVLTIAIPGGHHNLNPLPAFDDVSAPRVLRRTDSDFQLVTRVAAFPVPDAGTSSNGPHSFYGAGLLLWQDEKNLVRFMRAANGESGRVFVHLECFNAGRMVASQVLDIADAPALLRVIRTGDELQFSYGDGMQWTALEPGAPVRLARTLQVGVAGVNSTVKPFIPRLDQFQFQQNVASSAERWVQLFNGKDLAGWKFHPDHPGNWEVKDGILQGSKRQSHLFSQRGDYRNFHLRAEVKINLKGDSGILFRAPLALRQGRTPYEFGISGCYEAELHQNRSHARPTGSISEARGDAPPTSLGRVLDNSLTEPDEWFTYEVIAENNHFITKINGSEAVNCTDPQGKHPTGHLALQVWHPNTLVQFRKIEIKELPAGPTASDGFVNLFNGRDLTGWKTHSLSGGDWKVEDGAIDGRGTTSYLFSESGDYDNFHLRVEAKINGNGDAGVYFRAPFDVRGLPNPGPAKFALLAGYEVAIALRANPIHTGSLTAADGSTLQAGPLQPHKPDEWFVLEVIAEDNHIRTLVDGKPAADYTDEKRQFSRGHIALQTWGSGITSVQFRKVEIKELPASASSAVTPAFAVAPFDTAQAKAHQAAWARHLGVPVEREIALGADADGKEVRLGMVLIPPGEFLMGSSDEVRVRLLQEAKVVFDEWAIPRIPSEGPQHRVRITKPFWLSKCEVNIRQFRRFAQAASFKTEAERDGKGGIGFVDGNSLQGSQFVWNGNVGFPQTDDHPVVNVAWPDSKAFCDWLSQQQGGAKFALPTEAQWEYACRAGTTTTWHTGDSDKDVLISAWLIDNAGRTTQPVGQRAPNAFGLHDMHGNVGEWCGDWYSTSHYAHSATNDSVGPSTGITRVIRGGQFDWKADHARSAFRVDRPPTFRQFNYGFRVSAAISDDAIRAKLPPDGGPTATPNFTNRLGMEFVIVPKGKSWLGGGKDKLSDQEVEIPADFYLGKYEVTQEEWEQVMGENPSHFSRTGDGKDAVKDISDADLKRFPVENVSWDQCQVFVAKLNQREKETGWGYRLPNEAEWEYACRGGPMLDEADSAFDFHFAEPTNTLLPEQANFKHDQGLNRSCKVGSYQPNRLGLFDMHGNAWEWCTDTFVEPTDGTLRRVGRGGYWDNESFRCVAAHRNGHSPTFHYRTIGLRLARVPSGAPSPEVKTPLAAASPFTDVDAQRIAALPAAEQVEEVRKELMRRNPSFDGQMTHKIEDGVVTEFKVVTDQVRDIAPIRVFNSLQVLDLSGTATNYHGNSQLADLSPLAGMNLAGLTYLDLSWTQVGSAGLVHFQDCKNLWFLGLDSTQVTDAGLPHFKDCTSLRYLSLSRTKVGDAGLAHFQDCKQLTHLRLGGTQVSDAGLAYFKDCKSLTSLFVNSTLVSNAGLAPFEGCKELTMLHLQSTRVSDAGLAHFKDCKKLTRLVIALTQVTDLSLLKEMPLKNLDCDFRPERDAEILRSIKTLETINGQPAAEFWQRHDNGESQR